ncbi:MAG: hypothetical protein ACYDAA_11705 [Syntrophales bacterium]
MSEQAITRFHAAFLSLVLSISLGLIGGCSGSDSGSETIVQGWVSAQGPISGANVVVSTVSGYPIYRTDEPATGDLGSFMIAVKGLPPDFRVAAKAGNREGAAFPSELRADVRKFDPETGIIYLNVVTTMVSAYLDGHPDKTLDEATLIVKEFLKIPAGVDIGSGLNGSGQYFSHRLFIEEAAPHGGVSQYIDQLVAQMGGGTGATHPFPGGEPGALGGPAAFIAGELAKGALSYVGGKVFGWGLSKTGLEIPDATLEAFKLMSQQLVQVSQQLDALDVKLTKIYSELYTEIKQNNYDIRVGQMGALISNINGIRNQVTIFISRPPANKTLLETKRWAIINLIETKLLGNENIMHDQLSGLGGQTPLLKVWSQVVKSKHRFLSSTDSVTIKDQYDYFETLQGWMLELLVEYYHATGEGEEYHEGIDSALKGYNEHIAVQKTLLLKAIPQGHYLDRENGLMIFLPDNYDERYSGAFLPGYTGGLTGSFHEGLMFVSSNMNDPQKIDVFAFNDWRLPSPQEMSSIFAGWTTSPWEIAKSRGLTAMKGESRFPAASQSITWFLSQYSQPSATFDYYQTTNGATASASIRDQSPVSFMPVRKMAPDELSRYVW